MSCYDEAVFQHQEQSELRRRRQGVVGSEWRSLSSRIWHLCLVAALPTPSSRASAPEVLTLSRLHCIWITCRAIYRPRSLKGWTSTSGSKRRCCLKGAGRGSKNQRWGKISKGKLESTSLLGTCEIFRG